MIGEIEIFFSVFFYAFCILNPPPPQRIRILTIVENRIFFFFIFLFFSFTRQRFWISQAPPHLLLAISVNSNSFYFRLPLSFLFFPFFFKLLFSIFKSGRGCNPRNPLSGPTNVIEVNQCPEWNNSTWLSYRIFYKFLSGEISLMLKFNDLF